MKVNKCPHCKSTKGFKITFTIKGLHTMELSFNGTIQESERNTFDEIDNHGTCLNCGRSIPTEKLRTDKA